MLSLLMGRHIILFLISKKHVHTPFWKGATWRKGDPFTRLDSNQSALVSEFCYLGHIIHNDLSGNRDHERQVNSCNVKPIHLT